MAYGLVPIALRLNLDPALRLALAIVCDLAIQRPDGSYSAVVSARALAAILSVSENSARKLIGRLRDLGFLSRGPKQSHWLVTLPGKRAANDIVRRNWTALDGQPDAAPIISKLWEVSRRERREKPAIEGRFSLRKTGHTGAVFGEKNRPSRGKKKAIEGRFQNPSNYRFTDNTHSHASGQPNGDDSAAGEFEQCQSTMAGAGLAEKGSPDASQQTSAVEPDTSGMMG